MLLQELMSKAIDVAMMNDPRGKEVPQKELAYVKQQYKEKTDKEKLFFDPELLVNPYPDSRISWGDGNSIVKGNVVVGIDIFGAEIIAAHDKFKPSLIISHHPEGKGSISLWRVLDMQVGIFEKFGVDIGAFSDLAKEGAVKRLYEHAERYVLEDVASDTTEQECMIAKLYGIPLVSLHTAADNCVATYLQNLLDTEKPNKVGDIIDILMEIPEYQIGCKNLTYPHVTGGKSKHSAGKILVDMTGGLESPPEVISAIKDAGIDTVVGMHASSGWYVEAEKCRLNLVIAGHIPSDNLGLNLLLDQVLPDDVNVHELSGFQRVSRKGK